VGFVVALACYCVATLAYSFWLKRQALLDVFTLAGLYTVRILAGAAAIDVPLSNWLLLFSLFLFLSLALAKRYVELTRAGDAAQRLPGRDYGAGDGALLGVLGVASGQVSILVFALYVASPESAQLYRHPALLWIACPVLLYWIARVWLLAYRGRLADDPLVFALRDPVSIAAGIAVVAAVMAAI